MGQLSHSLEYITARTIAKIAQSLSPKVADSFGAGIGFLAGTILKSRHRLAANNIRQALGDSLSETEIEEITQNVFKNLGRTLIEFSRFKKTGQAGLKKIVVGAGMEAVKEAQGKGNGGIILTAHYGNWEMLGAWFASQGVPIDFLVANQSNQQVSKLINSFRRDIGGGVISIGAGAKTGARSVFKTLRSNGFVGMAADQHAPTEAVIIDFFGRKVSVPRGAGLFALKCKCPIIPVLIRRESYNCHVMVAADPIYPMNTGNEEKDVRSILTQYTSFLEEQIRLYPDQWLWTHNRWKNLTKIGNPASNKA